MARFHRLAQPAALFFGTGALVVSIGRPLQTALQPPPIVPTGRVCIAKHFGSSTATGLVEPFWFLNTGAITVGADRNLYSTSPSGGKYGAGTIFRTSPTGEVKVLHDFVNYNKNAGAAPQSGLLDGGDGWFYGTTYGGGHLAVGTIFRIRPGDTAPQILFSFRNGFALGLKPDCPDGRCPYTGRQRADMAPGYPIAPPVRAPDGTLYGVTPYSNNQGFGVLYRMAPPYDSTTFRTLCIFDQRLKADTAMAGYVCKAKGTFSGALLLAPDRVLYGTTLGANGSVFRATTGGDVTTIHEFDLTHGSKPYNLILASNGRLYGTTSNGGDTGGGIVYRLDTSGDGLFGGGFTVMSSFRVGSSLQGFNPVGGLTEVKPSGSIEPFLFGTTKYGGKGGRGILFRIPLDGDSLSLRVLHDFDLYTTGRSSVTAPVQGPGGLLYGVTYQGGSYDHGVLYTLDPIVLNDQTTHDATLAGGTRAVGDDKMLISDPIVEVWVNALASQTGTDPAIGAVKTVTMNNGIIVRGRCPNAHIVQFLYREVISPEGIAWAGMNLFWSGITKESIDSYPLTIDPKNIQWHTDSPRVPMKPFEQRNAYLDQGIGAAHTSTPTMVAIFDKPTFGVFDDPIRPSPLYDPTRQTADPSKSETWRATARDFLICNCQVTKEIWWSREVRGQKSYYAHIKVVSPASGALTWINGQLKQDGYAPIP